MKAIIKFLIIFLLFFPLNKSVANEKIVFINMDYILNKSLAGISIQTKLEKLHKVNLANLKSQEEKLKNKEKDIISKKNILKKEEFEDQIIKLRDEAREFQNSRAKLTNELNKKRKQATQKILDEIRPLLAAYSEKEKISLIMDKKNIIVGKKNLDITKIIIDQLNKKFPNVNID